MAVSAKRTNEIRMLTRLVVLLGDLSAKVSRLKEVVVALPVAFTDTIKVRNELNDFRDDLRTIQLSIVDRYAAETADSLVDAKVASVYLQEGIDRAKSIERRLHELYDF